MAPPEAESLRAASLRGQGCGAGIVTGRVHVVSQPQQVLARVGEIIACSTTDPSWTPVFPACAGILTERGSVLGHAAVVAREFGIPAIVAIPGLLEWIRDGDIVQIDGATGIVTLVSD